MGKTVWTDCSEKLKCNPEPTILSLSLKKKQRGNLQDWEVVSV